MSNANSVVATFDSHDRAEDAIRELQKSGFDMKKLSIVGKDYQTEENVVGYYTTGDRMLYWGKLGGFWGLLLGSAFFWVAAQIGVSAANGVVTLNGTVGTYAEKWAVERAAQRVHEVKGIAEENTVRLDGLHARTDAENAETAPTSLKWHVWLPNDIQAIVSHGWVTLKGQVNWEYQRSAAHDSVCFLPGMKGVTNEISLKPKAQPTAIKDAIEKALVLAPRLTPGM